LSLQQQYSSSEVFQRLLGREVRDLYGGYLGRVSILGTDGVGKVSFLGIDAGSSGFLEVPYERVAIKDETLIVVPNWKFEAARISRELNLTRKRVAALEELVKSEEISNNDYQVMMQEYTNRGTRLQEQLKGFSTSLQRRVEELRNQRILAKKALVNLKVLFKSEEIDSSVYASSVSNLEEIGERLQREESDLQAILDLIKTQKSQDNQDSELASDMNEKAEVSGSSDFSDRERSQNANQEKEMTNQTQQQSTWLNKIIRVGKS
jgi:hypothetical protein